MNQTENIKEGLRSIQSNLLRTVLTALIIAIGITSLVGILTAIDGIQKSVSDSFSSLGANTFDIVAKGEDGRRGGQGGIEEKSYPPIRYDQAKRFKENFTYPAITTIHVRVTGNAELKRLSKKTNPNYRIHGIDDNFIPIKGYNIKSGRNLSSIEIQYGSNVTVIGQEVVKALFEDDEDPVNKEIVLYGVKCKIVGVLEKTGGMGGSSGPDRTAYIPLDLASRLMRFEPRYQITVAVSNPVEMDAAIGEATGIMRVVRQDRITDEGSILVEKSESVAESLNEITGYLRIGGFTIGLITLLGASVGLMNIMMVSVTERTREIGVRKALGATPQKIRMQFLAEALVVCQLGGIAGIILGILIGNLIANLISPGTFVVPWLWMLVGLVICFVVGIVSGYYPAHKASKLDPIESLRFE